MGSCRGGNSITVNCKNCKIGGYHDSSFLTSGTRPAQVSGHLLPCAEKAVSLQRNSERQIALTIPSALSPKWVPSDSQVSPIFWRQGWEEGRRRIQKDSAGFRRIQKTLLDFACKGTKIYWDNKIIRTKLCKINKIFSSSALRNAQSPWEQIVRSEAKIRMVRRFFGITKD